MLLKTIFLPHFLRCTPFVLWAANQKQKEDHQGERLTTDADPPGVDLALVWRAGNNLFPLNALVAQLNRAFAS